MLRRTLCQAGDGCPFSNSFLRPNGSVIHFHSGGFSFWVWGLDQRGIHVCGGPLSLHTLGSSISRGCNVCTPSISPSECFHSKRFLSCRSLIGVSMAGSLGQLQPNLARFPASTAFRHPLSVFLSCLCHPWFRLFACQATPVSGHPCAMQTHFQFVSSPARHFLSFSSVPGSCVLQALLQGRGGWVHRASKLLCTCCV